MKICILNFTEKGGGGGGGISHIISATILVVATHVTTTTRCIWSTVSTFPGVEYAIHAHVCRQLRFDSNITLL